MHEWDRGIIEAKFCREDAKAILRIPLSRRHVPDAISWLPNKIGVHSVKSSNNTARMLSREVNGLEESSVSKNRCMIWPKLWKLHIPNKIKVFGWRVCQDILPIRENLVCRRIIKDGTCEFCKQVSESMLHVLWECGVAQDVWAKSQVCLQKSVSRQADKLQLVEDLMDKLTVEDLELFLVPCWIIWNQRNSVLHDGTL